MIDRSICKWTIECHFKNKHQIYEFINLLMEHEVFFEFRTWMEMEQFDESYYVNVEGSGAHNLVEVSKFMKQVDMKFDEYAPA